MIKTPIVRNGKQATVGYQPDILEKLEIKEYKESKKGTQK